MSDWLSPSGLITIVIGFTLLEGVALWIYRVRTGKGVAAKDFVANWVSGHPGKISAHDASPLPPNLKR